MTAPAGVDPREWHYREFYQVGPITESRAGPLLLVHGNCQAEAMRILLSGNDMCQTVRVPPVHELTPRDVEFLDRLLPRVTHLVAQPVADNYRGLPIGTDQVVARTRGAKVVRFPVLRDAALYPFQAIVRSPPLGDPPGVPYHDLRVLARAAAADDLPARWPAPDAVAVREVARRSRAELLARQERAGAVDAVAEFDLAGADRAHVINHPGNTVLLGVARRVLAALGLPSTPATPDRTLLGRLRAPLQTEVIEALGLEAKPRPYWLIDGAEVDPREIETTQLQWYREHPEVIDAGLARHGGTMRVLGL